MDLGVLRAYAEMKDDFSSPIDKFVNGVERMEKTWDKFSGSFKGAATVIGGSILGLGAAVAGLTGAIFALAMAGDEVNDITEAFEGLSGGAANAEASLAALRSGTLGTISDLELMKESNVALGAGLKLTAKDFETLGQSAVVLAKRTGGSVTQSYSTMISAMVSGRTRALEMAGAQIDLEKSTLRYANSIGKSVGELSKQEKQAANTTAVLDGMRGVLEASGPPQASFADNVQRMQTMWTNFMNALERAVSLSPTVNKALEMIDKMLTQTFGNDQSKRVETIVGYINSFIVRLLDLAKYGSYVAEVFTLGFKGIQLIISKVIEGLATAVAEIAGELNQLGDMGAKIPLIGDKIKAIVPGNETVRQLHVFADAVGEQSNDIMTSMENTVTSFDSTRKSIEGYRIELEKTLKTPIKPPGGGGGGGGGRGPGGGGGGDDTQKVLDQMRNELIGAQNRITAMLRAPGVDAMGVRTFAEQFGGSLEEVAKKAELLGTTVPAALAAALQKTREFKVSEMMKTDLPAAQAVYQGYEQKLLQLTMNGAEARHQATEVERAAALESLDEQIRKETEKYELLKQPVPPEMLDAWKRSAESIEAYFKQVDVGKSLGKSLEEGLGGLPDALMNAVQGGGNALKSLGSSLGGSIFGKDTKITKDIGAKLGSLVGLAMPIVGSIAGPIVGALGDKLIGSLFGGEKKKVKKALDAFVKSEGGMDMLTARADEAGVSMDKLFDASKMKDFEAELEKVKEQLEMKEALNALAEAEGGMEGLEAAAKEAGVSLEKAFDATNMKEMDKALEDIKKGLALHDEAMEGVNAAMEKYGLSVKDMGPAWQQQNIAKRSFELLQEFKLLTAAGADVGVVLEKMSKQGDLTKLIEDARATGQALPLAMKPMIDSMAAAGQLTDGMGHSFKTAEEAGITFSATLDEKFGSLLDKIDKLINALLGIPDTPVTVQPAGGPVGTGQGAPPGTPASGYHGPSYANGTDGFQNFGSGTMAMLHGWEAVVPKSSFAGDGGGMGMAAGAISVGGAQVSIGQIVVPPGTDQEGAVTIVRMAIERANSQESTRLIAAMASRMRDRV